MHKNKSLLRKSGNYSDYIYRVTTQIIYCSIILNSYLLAVGQGYSPANITIICLIYTYYICKIHTIKYYILGVQVCCCNVLIQNYSYQFVCRQSVASTHSRLVGNSTYLTLFRTPKRFLWCTECTARKRLTIRLTILYSRFQAFPTQRE